MYHHHHQQQQQQLRGSSSSTRAAAVQPTTLTQLATSCHEYSDSVNQKSFVSEPVDRGQEKRVNENFAAMGYSPFVKRVDRTDLLAEEGE